MLIKDVMNRSVVVVKPNISLRGASKLMCEKHIGSLIVVENEEIVGILTQTDILKAVAEERDLDLTTVEEVMNKKVFTIDYEKTIEDAVDLMMEKKIKRLPVTKDGKLVGIITASDIITVEPKLITGIASLLSMKIPGYKGG
ncbi:MAG: CBS domain-containing protein [Candidatus Aenigmatarchaeota archaeon]